MFDSVGVNNDPEAAKRSFWALVVTFSSIGVVVAAVVAYGAWKATQYIVEQVMEEEEMVEVVINDPMGAPPPPPPPPPPASGAAEPEDPEEVQPTPDEMMEDIPELSAVDERITETLTSEELGVEGGQIGGVEGGVVGGVEGGQIGGVLGNPVTMHHSEIQVRKRVQPVYPDAAYDLGLGVVTCQVRVHIDEKGEPQELQIESCPQVFHRSLRQALMEWRWYPAKLGGDKVRAQFLMAVRYVP